MQMKIRDRKRVTSLQEIDWSCRLWYAFIYLPLSFM